MRTPGADRPGVASAAPSGWRAPVLMLGWVSFLTDVSSEMIYPFLPGYLTRVLGAGPAAIGLIEGVSESTAALTKMASGALSDRLARRKPLVLLGYTIAAIARPCVALTASWTQVLAVRFCDRVGKGIRSPPRDALLADLVPAAERGAAFGLQRAMDHAGAMVGPLIAAALIAGFGMSERNLFLLAAVPGCLGVVLLAARVREPARAAPVPAPPAATATGASDSAGLNAGSATPLPRPARTAIILLTLFTLANSSDTFLLLRARDTGVSMAAIPLLWAFFHLIKALLGKRGGALSDRIGRVPALALGWTVYALAYLGFAMATRAHEIWVLFALYAVHFALVEGAERALLADLAPAESRGRAFGAFHAAVGLAALPSSLLFGLMWSAAGPGWAFLYGAALATIATIALLALNRGGYFARSAGSPSRL